MARVGRRGRVGAIVVVATALAAVLAPGAGAQAPQPDPRAEAAALARIAVDARAKLRVRAPLVERSLKRLERFSEGCPAFERASSRAPEEDVEALSVAVTTRFFYGPLLGTLDRFAGDLEAAAVTDSALRDGVMGWRTAVQSLQLFARLPDRLCAAVRRWARAGYPRERAPIDADELNRADKRGERAVKTIERGSRRLRALGASTGAAKAFTLEGLLEASLTTLEESEEGSSGSPQARSLSSAASIRVARP